MAQKRITTELAVKAVDRYSSVLHGMQSTTGRFAGRVRKEMSSLQKMRGPLTLIDDYRKQKDAVEKASNQLARARETLKSVRKEISASAAPSDAMIRRYKTAAGVVTRLEKKHSDHRKTLHGTLGALRAAGVNAANLSSEERRLTTDLNRANDAIGRRIDKLQAAQRLQNRLAENRERLSSGLAVGSGVAITGYAGMATGRRILSGVSSSANQAGDLQAAYTEFQNLTGANDQRMEKLRGELDALRAPTGLGTSELLEGLGVLVGKGMDFEAALAALPAMGRAATATSTSFEEMAASGFALYDNLKLTPEALAKAFDVMAKSGKEGGFELTAMARKFPEITAGAQALGMDGMDAVASLTAALQVAMKSAGSEDQAANNMANFLGKITSPETVKNFRKFGVSIEKELATAVEKGVDPIEHIVLLVDRLTKGNAFKAGQLFGDKQVLDFLRAMVPNLEEFRRIRDTALNADGVIDEDFARVMENFNAQKKQFSGAWKKLWAMPPEALESLTALLKVTTSVVERIAEWKDAHPELTKALFLGSMAVGAMAVAGGALMVAAGGLIGSLAVLRFGIVGLGARALYSVGGIGRLAKGIAALAGLKRFPLARLITPLKWTAALLPAVDWTGMSRRSGKFGMTKSGWGRLITPLKWFGRGALRLIPVIGWATAAASIGLFAWKYLGLKKLIWDNWIGKIDWSGWFSFAWADLLPKWDWKNIIPELSFWGSKPKAGGALQDKRGREIDPGAAPKSTSVRTGDFHFHLPPQTTDHRALAQEIVSAFDGALSGALEGDYAR